MIQVDTNTLRANLTDYMKKYSGKKIYITKYNRVIGEFKFYTKSEKDQVMVDIAKEILKESSGNGN